MSRLYHSPLLVWALAFLAGAALYGAGAGGTAIGIGLFAAGAVGVIAGLAAPPAMQLRRTAVALLWLTPLFLAIGFWRADAGDSQPGVLGSLSADGSQTVVVAGVVEREPQHRFAEVETLLRVAEVRLGDETLTTDERVRLLLPPGTEAEIGDRMTAAAAFNSTFATAEGDDPGYERYLRLGAITASGRAERVIAIEPSQPSAWQRFLKDARDSINSTLAAALPIGVEGLAQGMLTGRVDGIDSELRRDFNASNLSHIIVISGSNLSLLAMVAFRATGWWAGRRTASLLAMAAALAYFAFLQQVGADPPVLRATVMTAALLGSSLLASAGIGYRLSPVYAVVGAASVLVAIEPPALLQVSFQLSFAGTLGIALFAPRLVDGLFSGEAGLLRAAADVTLITLAATLATLPLIALHFERVSAVGLVANLLTVPLFPWMFLGAGAVGVLGTFWSGGASVLAWPLVWLPLRWLSLVAEVSASLPLADAVVRGFTTLHALVVYGAMALVSLRPRWELIPLRAAPTRARVPLAAPLLASGVLAVAVAMVWQEAFDHDPRLAMHFLDVGQGDAAVMRTPSGQIALVDSGASVDRLTAQLRDTLPERTRRIDLLVLTHPQVDHGGAAFSLLNSYDVGALVVSPYADQRRLGRSLIARAQARGVEIVEVSAGCSLTLPGSGDGDVVIDVLWPPGESDCGAADASEWGAQADDPNALGLVLRVRYGETAYLLSADIGLAEEIQLATAPCIGTDGGAPCELSAQVLKVAHHGSRHSSGDIFLRRVRPAVAVISAGADNAHGHPAPDAVSALADWVQPEMLLTTAEAGRISIYSDGTSLALAMQR